MSDSDSDVEDASPATLSRVGLGISSISQLPELQRLTSLESLCLHGNNIASLEGLSQLRRLSDLNVSSNLLASLDGLASLTSLTKLNLSSNKIQNMDGIGPLGKLVHLNVSYNYISDISGLSQLQAPGYALATLDLRQNAISSLQSFASLAGCSKLSQLLIAGNPVSAAPKSYGVLRSALQQLQTTDESSPSTIALPYGPLIAQQVALAQLQAFDRQLQPAAAPHPPQHQQQRDHQPQSQDQAKPPQHQQSKSLPASGKAEPQQSDNTNCTPSPQTAGVSSPAAGNKPKPAGHNQALRSSSCDGPHRSPAHCDTERQNPSLSDVLHSPQRPKIRMADATCQTADNLPLVHKLHAEGKELREKIQVITGMRWVG